MVNSVPNTPQSDRTSTSKLSQIADPDIIIFEENLPIEGMADLLFEDIGGQEIINIARNDIVNGQEVAYRPIKNLSKIALKYNSQNLSPVQDSSKSFFNNFPIKLENHIPDSGSGPNGEIVYIETDGSLVVNVVGLAPDERIEVQILARGAVLDDTIYTGES